MYGRSPGFTHWFYTLHHPSAAESKHTPTQGGRHTGTVTRKKKQPLLLNTRTRARFLGWEINYYNVCRSLRLIPPVMDVTLCGAAKCA